MASHEKKFFPKLSALLDGELEASTRAELVEHLKICDQCRETLDDFRTLRRYGSGLEPFPANPFFQTRIRAKLKDAKTRIQDPTGVEAKLFVPLFITLVITLIFLFSFNVSESNGATDDYLYFSGRSTLAEQQLLSHRGPISNDDVLLLSVTTSGGEESNGR